MDEDPQATDPSGTDEMPRGADLRNGILDWQVADVGEAFGCTLQLTRDTDVSP